MVGITLDKVLFLHCDISRPPDNDWIWNECGVGVLEAGAAGWNGGGRLQGVVLVDGVEVSHFKHGIRTKTARVGELIS